MTDEQIIEKATHALKELGMYSNNYYRITVVKVFDDEILLELEPELEHQYSVIFSYKQPDGRGASTSVDVDRYSHKLLTIITRSNMYEVPEELQ